MTDVPTHDDRRSPLVAPRPGPLGRLAGVAYRRRGRVVLGWMATLAIAIGLSAAFAGDAGATAERASQRDGARVP
jgi:putative drug exporter of the RND superfamily